MERYKCIVCGYIYDPEQGDQSGDIEPNTAFNDLPVDYICPICGAGKEEFIKYD
jgi:rubredoxin